MSLLPFVLAADAFPDYSAQGAAYPLQHPDTGEPYVPFHLCRGDFEAGLAPVGLLRAEVVSELQAPENAAAYEFVANDGDGGAATATVDATTPACVTFAPEVVATGTRGMSAAVARTADVWRRAGKFKAQLDGS